jgi:hypothetical protein
LTSYTSTANTTNDILRRRRRPWRQGLKIEILREGQTISVSAPQAFALAAYLIDKPDN